MDMAGIAAFTRSVQGLIEVSANGRLHRVNAAMVKSDRESRIVLRCIFAGIA